MQQDPREKLELFPKLGYYFIVFRAIENKKTQEKFRPSDLGDVDTEDDPLHDEGVIGEANVYLIVFNEGICSVSTHFHFR